VRVNLDLPVMALPLTGYSMSYPATAPRNWFLVERKVTDAILTMWASLACRLWISC